MPNKLTYFGYELQEAITNPVVNTVESIELQRKAALTLEFNAEMELQVGDKVMYKYINHLGCMQDGLFVDVGRKRLALLMSYDSLFMGEREGHKFMLNGFMFVEPILWTLDELRKQGGFQVQKDDLRKEGIGVVRMMGKPLKGYMDSKQVDTNDISIGDTVVFKKTAPVLTEYKYHKQLGEGKYPWYRLQRKDILYYKKQN